MCKLILQILGWLFFQISMCSNKNKEWMIVNGLSFFSKIAKFPQSTKSKNHFDHLVNSEMKRLMKIEIGQQKIMPNQFVRLSSKYKILILKSTKNYCKIGCKKSKFQLDLDFEVSNSLYSFISKQAMKLLHS